MGTLIRPYNYDYLNDRPLINELSDNYFLHKLLQISHLNLQKSTNR